MNNIMDFIRGALPWFAIGMFAAVSCSGIYNRNKGKKPRTIQLVLSWLPFILFMLTAVIEYASYNTSSATTWLIIGIANMTVNFFVNSSREKE